MILPILGALAIAWWMAAPDPVTAGARTAAGTGVRAAGAGVRGHWAAGRDGRKLTRTARRDRWSKGGGFWRNLLRLEHGAVITTKGVKGAAGITRAAVRPVPAAVRAGWNRGQERHRNRAGNRPVPVALDPPWWHREQPQVQAPEQVQVQPGNSSGGTPEQPTGKGLGTGADLNPAHEQHPSGLSPEQHCEWCDDRPRETKRGKLVVCWPCAVEIDAQIVNARLNHQPVEASGWPLVSEVSEIPECDIHKLTMGEPGVPAAYDAEMKSGAWAFMCPDCFEQHGTGELGLGKGQRLALKVPTTDPAEPLNSAPAPADGSTDGAPAPDTTTEGDPVFTSLDTDLDDLTTVQDFALKVADMAEESDFAQLVEFCKNASDEVRDFGADMAGDVAEFEEVAAKIGDLLSELVDAATKVKETGAELVGG